MWRLILALNIIHVQSQRYTWQVNRECSKESVKECHWRQVLQVLWKNGSSLLIYFYVLCKMKHTIHNNFLNIQFFMKNLKVWFFNWYFQKTSGDKCNYLVKIKLYLSRQKNKSKITVRGSANKAEKQSSWSPYDWTLRESVPEKRQKVAQKMSCVF